MQITNIRVDPIVKQDMPRLKGYARIAFDNQIAINKILIIQAARGMCVEFPKIPDDENTHFETIAPLNRKTRQYIQSLILQAFYLNADYFLVDRSA
jgi:DNA-binding cell septation regulator SpoVG